MVIAGSMPPSDDIRSPAEGPLQTGLAVADDVRSPITRALLDYWRNKKGDAPGLRWRDVNLMDIYTIAPYLCICDAEDDGREFRARYSGTGIAQMFHEDRTGKLLAEMFGPEAAKVVAERYRLAITANGSVRKVGQLNLAREDLPVTFEGIYLPLVGESGGIDHVISAYDFNFKPSADDALAASIAPAYRE
tara:strand:+ start:302 stop:874 length:573 start_codon:yes stop_codon:yes gene_type:complete